MNKSHKAIKQKPKPMTDARAVDDIYSAWATNQVGLDRFRRACKRLGWSDEAIQRGEYLAGYHEPAGSDVRPEFKD